MPHWIRLSLPLAVVLIAAAAVLVVLDGGAARTQGQSPGEVLSTGHDTGEAYLRAGSQRVAAGEPARIQTATFALG